jgi:hypothetical protein
VDAIDGCYQFYSYHSYTGNDIVATLALVQIDAEVRGSYRCVDHGGGLVPWGNFPLHDGDVAGEDLGDSGPRDPDGHAWRWRLSIAGTEGFVRPLPDGKLGLVRTPDRQYFDETLEPIQGAPGGLPYRTVAHYLESHKARPDRDTVGLIVDECERAPQVSARIEGLSALLRGESADIDVVIARVKGAAAEEERAYLDGIRRDWPSR